MNYKETVDYLYRQAPSFQKVGSMGYKEGLENTLLLDSHLKHPHRFFKSIHIAGTNGKGSTAHTLATILQKAHYKVGLYTSPHLIDFRERIRVNGIAIPEEDVVSFVEQERSFFEPLQPSFFEITTAMAFWYFRKAQVDYAVIEVGMGGRLDCTNIISPILSIITNISFDHTQFLGDTLEKIAGEKAGIMKKNIPAIIGETIPETRRVFIRKAQETGVPLTFAEDTPLVLQSTPDYTNGGINYQTSIIKDLHGELGGLCQEKNTNTILHAVIALQKLGLNISSGNIRDGFGSVCETSGLRGRWQVISETPKTVCDTGHNEGGFRYITEQLKKQDCKHLRIVFGMVSDKDITAVLRMLPQEAIYYFTQADTTRALSAEEMARQAALFNLRGKTYLSVSEAYRAAKADASNDDFIYIGGSTFIVADFLAAYNA
jgi:dihydrofolate synthase/folylpolyglutamate synthase